MPFEERFERYVEELKHKLWLFLDKLLYSPTYVDCLWDGIKAGVL